MPTAFPTNAVNGQVFKIGNQNWVFEAGAWKKFNFSLDPAINTFHGVSYSISETEPVNKDIPWVNPTTQTVSFYNPAATAWVQVSTSGNAPISTDTVNPNVTITAPANNTDVGTTPFLVTATATDNVAVAGVQLRINGVNQGLEDTVAPYSFTVDPNVLASGINTISVRARDTAGNFTVSSSINVNNTTTVANKKTYSFVTLPLRYAQEIPSAGAIADWQSFSHQGLIDAYNWMKTNNKKILQYNGQRPVLPSFALEDDGIALLVLAALDYKYGIYRHYYWESTYYKDFQNGKSFHTNVWKSAQTFGTIKGTSTIYGEYGRNYTNSDGVLFAPGTDKHYPTNDLGVDGPCVSLTFKVWAAGVRFVNLINLAKSVNPTATQAIVDTFGTGLTDVMAEADSAPDFSWAHSDIGWNIDPEFWEDKREALLAIIEGG